MPLSYGVHKNYLPSSVQILNDSYESERVRKTKRIMPFQEMRESSSLTIENMGKFEFIMSGK